MGYGRLARLAPLAGVLFTVIFVIGFLVAGETPEDDASVEEIFDHFDSLARSYAVAIALTVCGALFLLFASIVRDRMRRDEWNPPWLATWWFGGAVVYVVSLGIFALNEVALAELVDTGVEDAARALNVLNNNNFMPAVFGLAIMLFASAWHSLRGGVVPKWLGWIALVLAVAALTPVGFVSFLAFPIWVLVVSILLYRRPDTVETMLPNRAPTQA